MGLKRVTTTTHFFCRRGVYLFRNQFIDELDPGYTWGTSGFPQTQRAIRPHQHEGVWSERWRRWRNDPWETWEFYFFFSQVQNRRPKEESIRY